MSSRKWSLGNQVLASQIASSGRSSWILAAAFLAWSLAAVSTASAQYTTYTNADGTIFTQSSVLTIGGTINLSNASVVLPSNTGSVAGLAAMKVDPYLLPQYANNIWGNTDTPSLAFAPNIPSSTYPLMANSKFSSGGTGDDNAPIANNYTTWNNNTSFVYSGTVNIPQVTDPNGCISFLKQIDDNESLYIDGNQVFSLDAAGQAYAATYSQVNTSWLAPGPHKIQIVMYSGGGGAGPNSGWNLGFGWDLNGDYDSTGSTVTLNGGAGTLSTIANPPTGGVAATYDLSAVTNSGFTMPISSSTNSVFTSTLVNSFSTSLLSLSRSNGTLNVSSSGATNIFTGGLTDNGYTLSIIGGQTIPGTVQINGPVSLAGASDSTFNVQNNNTLVLYGVTSGTRGLHKIGSGTLVLGNYNTYSGSTTIDAGTLQLNMGGSFAALAPGSTATVNSGGNLSLMLGDGLGAGANAVNLKVSGGTVTAAAGFRQTLWNTVNMTGGLLTAKGAGVADGGTGFVTNYALKGNLNATSNSAGPATINADIGLRYDVSNSGSVTLNVTRGPATADLNVNGAIGNWNTPLAALTIAGNGITNMNGVSYYNGGTVLSGGTVNTNPLGLGTGPLNLAAGTVVNVAVSTTNGLLGSYYLNTASMKTAAPTNTAPTYYNAYTDLTNYFSSLGAPSLTSQTNLFGNGLSTDTNGQNTGFPALVRSAANYQYFEALYTGNINVSKSGTYTFGTASDDGSVIYIDGAAAPVVNNNFFQGEPGNNSGPQRTGTISLSAGTHQITIGMYQGTGGYGLEAYYQGGDTGGNMTLIPNSVLTPSASSATNTEMGLGSLQGAGRLNLGTANLTLGSDNTDKLFSGTISGSGNVTKIGGGIQTFSGVNSYSGSTTISKGVLSIANTYSLPGWSTNGSYLVASSAALAVSNTVTDGEITTILGTTNFASSGCIGFDTSAGPRTYSGVIADSLNVNGALGLAKVGSNTLTLTNVNTYTGGTQLYGGTLNINADTALGGASSPVSFHRNSTLQASAEGIVLNSARGVTIDNGIMATIDTAAFNNMTIAGPIGGAGSLTKIGAKTLILTGGNTYTGATTVSTGTLQLGDGTTDPTLTTSSITNSGALVYNVANAQMGSYTISGSGNVTKTGAGILTLSGSSPFPYTGKTLLAGGSIVLNSALPGGTGLYEGLVNGNNAFDLTTPIPLTGPQSTIQSVARWGGTTAGSQGDPATPNGGNNIFPADGGTGWGLNTTWGYSGYLLNSSSASVSYKFGKNFDDNVSLIIDGVSVVNDPNAGAAVVTSFSLSPGLHTVDLRFGQGPGAVGPNGGGGNAINGNNYPYNGYGLAYNTVGNTALGGTWNQMGASDPNTSFFANEVGMPKSSMVMSTTTTLDLSATGLGLVALGSLADAAGSPTGHQVLLGNNVLDTGLDNSSTVFSGVISGAGGLIKSGTGTFTLAGANTYSGSTSIGAGTLQLGDGAIGHDGSLATSGIANNSAVVYNLAGNQTVDYPISGVGTLTKAGSDSMLTLRTSNSYTGLTTISGGTLQLGDGTSGHDGAIVSNVLNNAALVYNLYGAQSYDGSIGGSGSLTKTGQGTLVLTNTSSYTGATLIKSGTLQLGGASLYGFAGNGAGWTLNGGATISNNIVTLTDGNNSEARSVFFNSSLPVGRFNASFTYLDVAAGTANNADGAAFVVQQDPRGSSALGDTGGALAYGGGAATIIQPSAAVEFNVYNGHTIGTNFVTNGATGNYNATGSVNLASGDPIRVNLSYDGINYLTETLTDLTTSATWSTTYTVGNFGGGTTAYFGFTGATGGQASTQKISDFNLSGGLLSPTTALQVAADAVLDLDGAFQTVGSLSGAGTVTNNSGITNAILAVSGGGAFPGTIQDGGAGEKTALHVTGGTLTLSGTNTYTGGTDVLGGTLVLDSPTAIQDGTSLAVGADAASIFGTAVAGTNASAASAVSPVPEPGTLVLLLAGLVVGFGVWRRRLGIRD